MECSENWISVMFASHIFSSKKFLIPFVLGGISFSSPITYCSDRKVKLSPNSEVELNLEDGSNKGVNSKAVSFKPKKIKSSIGSSHTLSQSQVKKISLVGFPKQLNGDEISAQLHSNSQTACCSKTNCFMKLFPGTDGTTTDYNSCVKFLQECREETRTKDKDEKDRFLLDSFKRFTVDLSAKRLIHNWQLLGGKKVCRGTFEFAYGFTKYDLDMCSSKLRVNPLIENLRPPTYTDSTLHEYNYNETEAMMEDNFLDPGNFFISVFHFEFTFLSIEMFLYRYSCYFYFYYIFVFILYYLHR